MEYCGVNVNFSVWGQPSLCCKALATIQVHQGVKPINTYTHTHVHEYTGGASAKGWERACCAVWAYTERWRDVHSCSYTQPHQLSQAYRTVCKLHPQQAGGVERQGVPKKQCSHSLDSSCNKPCRGGSRISNRGVLFVEMRAKILKPCPLCRNHAHFRAYSPVVRASLQQLPICGPQILPKWVKAPLSTTLLASIFVREGFFRPKIIAWPSQISTYNV